jgi:hypothetical protein
MNSEVARILERLVEDERAHRMGPCISKDDRDVLSAWLMEVIADKDQGAEARMWYRSRHLGRRHVDPLDDDLKARIYAEGFSVLDDSQLAQLALDPIIMWELSIDLMTAILEDGPWTASADWHQQVAEAGKRRAIRNGWPTGKDLLEIAQKNGR